MFYFLTLHLNKVESQHGNDGVYLVRIVRFQHFSVSFVHHRTESLTDFRCFEINTAIVIYKREYSNCKNYTINYTGTRTLTINKSRTIFINEVFINVCCKFTYYLIRLQKQSDRGHKCDYFQIFFPSIIRFLKINYKNCLNQLNSFFFSPIPYGLPEGVGWVGVYCPQ